MKTGMRDVVGIALALSLTIACGKESKKDDPEGEIPVAVGGGDVRRAPSLYFAFSLTTLYESLKKAASASTLTLGVSQSAPGLSLADEQSSKYPRCSGNGEPWDVVNNRPMSPSARDYGQLAFYCQFNSNESRRTIRSTLERNKRILCDIERVLGGPAYAPEGTVYENVPFDPTEACGFSVDESLALRLKKLTAKVTATAMDVGNWPYRLTIEIPNFFHVVFLFRVDGTSLSVKELETWYQDEYDRDNEYVPGNAQGVSGHIVTMDTVSGLIQAEIGDTYWGLRARILGQGVVDKGTGYLTDLKASRGIVVRYDKGGPEGASYLDALVAGIGTDKDGRALYSTASYTCAARSECDVNDEGFEAFARLTPSPKTCVAASGTCDAASGIDWTKSPEILSFLKIGGSWDDQGGSRGVFEDWLVKTQAVKIGDQIFASTLE